MSQTLPCGCCQPSAALTPLDETNRAWLSAIAYRVGTYSSFRESMLEQIARTPGIAELKLGHLADARRTFRTLTDLAPTGYLAEASALREAETDEALGDRESALAIYDELSKTKTTNDLDDVLMR